MDKKDIEVILNALDKLIEVEKKLGRNNEADTLTNLLRSKLTEKKAIDPRATTGEIVDLTTTMISKVYGTDSSKYPEPIYKFIDVLGKITEKYEEGQGVVGIGGQKGEEKLVCEDPRKPGEITFEDLAGLEKEKEKVKISFIYPFIFRNLFRKRPKGIMFYGPPGTGKTMIVKASTAEISNVAFFSPLPGQLKGKYEGETEKNIENVFKCASQELNLNPDKYKFAIIFFDEFDSIVPVRSAENPGAERSVNTFLQIMDGIASDERISIIGVTNLLSRIDEAVLRRFLSKIFVNLPDNKAREFIIRQALSSAFNFPDAVERDKKRSKYGIKDRSSYETKIYVTEDREIVGGGKYLENIEKYGYVEKIEIGAGLITRAKTEEKIRYVTNDFIKEIVKMTGPKKEAKKDMEDERPDETEYDTAAKYKYGYSASDVDSMMQIAINNSSFEVVEDKKSTYNKITFNYYEQTLEGTGKYTEEDIKSMTKTSDARFIIFDDSKENKTYDKFDYTYYIYNPRKEGKTYYQTIEDQGQLDKIITFNITPEMINRAIDDARATVIDYNKFKSNPIEE